jgi:hypothetical protein
MAVVLAIALFAQVEVLAEQAGVPVEELRAASDTTGMPPDEYLFMTGELSRPSAMAAIPTVWQRLAQCESGGRWHIDAYHDGGLQFLPSTWTAYGGGKYARYAWQATPEQQVEIAQKLQAVAGWGQWPVCSRRLGLR